MKKARHPVLTDGALELVAARFRAMGDKTRLRLLNTLMQGESSVQELVAATGFEQSTVSRQLAVLRQERIVSRRREGNRALYSIQDPTIGKICEIVCGGLANRLGVELEAIGGVGR